VLLLVALAPHVWAEAPGRKFALVVGINRYDSNNLRTLRYAERDVEELATTLRATGYDEPNVHILTRGAPRTDRARLPDGKTIRADLAELLAGCGPRDTILLAFAGHGVHFQGDRDNYFCPADANLKDRDTLLSFQEVLDLLEKCPAAVKLVLVDACRNDPRSDTARGGAEIELESIHFQPAALPGGMAVLFSCSEGEEAHEDDTLQHGVFFHFVIEGLRGSAARGGRITVGDLSTYVMDNVTAFARSKQQEQQPNLVNNLRGPVILATLDELGAAAARTARVGEVRCLRGHSQVISGVAFFPRSERAVSSSLDGTVRVWDLRTGNETARFGAAGDWYVRSVAVAPDDRFILTAGYADRTLRLWDVQTGQEVKRFRGHQDRPCSAAFAPDGRFIASGGQDGLVILWDVAEGKELHRFMGHVGEVTSVAYSADSRFILSGGADGTVRLWDAIARKPFRTLRGHTGSVLSVALAAGRAVSGGEDGTVRLWDVDTGEGKTLFRLQKGAILSVAVSRDGQRVLCGGEDHLLRLWNAETREAVDILRGHRTGVTSVTLSADGRRALSGAGAFGPDDTVRLWQLPR
jgi:WD40 repeat protein